MTRRPIVAVVAAVAAVSATSTAFSAAPIPIPTPTGGGGGGAPVAGTVVDSAHSAVIAQGLAFAGDGTHTWTLESYALDAPVEVPSPGPTFILGSAGGTQVIETDSELYHAHLVAGEAVMIPGGSGARLTGSVPGSQALVIGLRGGEGERPFELVEGVYDIELVRDVLAPGERLAVGGATASLLLVRSGAVTLGDGQTISAGYVVALAGDVVLVNTDAVSAEVHLVTASPIAVELATAADPLAAPEPPAEPPAEGGEIPADGGVGEPAGQQPAPSGSAAPAPTNPPSGTNPQTPPGSTAAPSPSSTAAPAPSSTAAPAPSSTAAPTTAPPTTAAPTTAAPTTAPPQQGESDLSASIHSCSTSGSQLRLTVKAQAGPLTAYRRNVRSVTVSVKNEYGNWVGETSLSWIGRDTAQRDEWSSNSLPRPHTNHRDDGVRIVVRSEGGQTLTIHTSDRC